MPRYLRALLRGYPHHIIQRGHDRQPVFANGSDYRVYLANLREQLDTLNVSLFSYCLMTNHIHLLVQPERDGADLSRLMRVVSARQTRYVNRLEHRTGTLWEGRFKCSIVDSEKYLLACCRYIELNPVRARMVHRPAEYAWSSYRERVGLDVPTMALVSFSLDGKQDRGGDEGRRRYESFVAEGQTTDQNESITRAVNRDQLTGDNQFRDEIERKLGRRVSDRAPGRPRKPAGDDIA
jgi:REP-associated tyrosine transposase